MSRIRDLAIEYNHCARCGARPGEQCRTISDARATHPHGTRVEPARVGWRAGYEEALRDAVNNPDYFAREVEWFAAQEETDQ